MQADFEVLAVSVPDISLEMIEMHLSNAKRALKRNPSFGDLCTFTLLSASSKSCVWRARSQLSMQDCVIKYHLEQRTFVREWNGYLIFRGGPIATLLGVIECSRLLIVSHGEGAPISHQNTNAEEMLRHVAMMHQTALSNLAFVQSISASRMVRSGNAGNQSKSNSMKSQVNTRSHVRHHSLFVNIGDLKPAHCIIGAGAIRIVDLETSSFCTPCWSDVLAIVAMLAADISLRSLYQLISFYCDQRDLSLSMDEKYRISVRMLFVCERDE